MIHHTPPGKKFFVAYPVVLLRDFPEENLKIGDTVKAEDIPNGSVYLLNSSGQVFCTAAKAGVTHQ